jgi:ferric-dicitrate binding protein FerR (iron transport regulator)
MYKLPTRARTVRLMLLTASVGICVTTLQAQSKEIATAIELEGQVSVLRHGAPMALFQKGTAGAPASLCTVNAKEEIVTGADGHAVFRIGDGSTFEVFPNSRVTFQGEWTIEDMLELVLGKIRVQIEHRNGPNHKRVETPTAVISVRGTVFDVAVEDDDGTTYVSVEEGQVQVHHRLQPGQDKFLNQNEWVRIYPNQPLAKATSPSPGRGFFWDRLKNAVADLVINNPGGIGGSSGGGPVGTGGAQGDSGKTKKPPPTGAPPAPPGGGN